MVDPVMTAAGHSYERVAIQQWLSTHTTDPLTRLALPNKILTPNHSLKKVIREYCDKRPQLERYIHNHEALLARIREIDEQTTNQLAENKTPIEGERKRATSPLAALSSFAAPPVVQQNEDNASPKTKCAIL